MKCLIPLALSAASIASAFSIETLFPEQVPLENEKPISSERYLIELSPGETRWVSEDEKWELLRVSLREPTNSNSSDG
jgi:leucyl aminopeptidase